jgi:hypothetical protein
VPRITVGMQAASILLHTSAGGNILPKRKG